MKWQSLIPPHRLLTGFCLLTLPAVPVMAIQVTDGTTLKVKQNQTASAIGDSPLNVLGQGSTIETGVDGLLFSSDKNSTPAAQAANKGMLILNNATITSSGKVADGVKLDNGSLNASGGTFTATGTASRAISANNNAQVIINDTMVNAAGSATAAINLSNQSTLEAIRARIVGADNAIGLQLKSSSLDLMANAVLKNSTISSQGSDALRIMNGDVSMESTTLSSAGANSYAINANSGANINAIGGRFQTTGENSDSVWLASDDSILMAQNASFVTAGNNAIALNAQFGEATLSGGSLETSGEDSYGLYTENKVKGDSLTVNTEGKNATGVIAARGGDINLKGGDINTKGLGATGLRALPNSSIEAINSTVSTNGSYADAIRSDAAKITLSDSKIITKGAGSAGISTVSAGTVDATNMNITTHGDGASALFTQQGRIDLTSGELNTLGQSAAITAGGGDKTLPTGSINLNTVTVNAYHGSAVQSKGGLLDLNAANSTLNSGTNVVLNVLTDKSSSEFNYGEVNLIADHSKLNGSLLSDSLSNVSNVTLANGSVLTGASKNISSVDLDNSSRWDMTESSDVQSLSNSGIIAFSTPSSSEYKTLTINGDYSGNGGQLYLNTLLGNDDSPTDMLMVTGDVKAGNTLVTINNMGGKGDYTVNGIEVVQVGGTSFGTFTSSGRIVAGNYDYRLQKRNENWYLTNEAPVTNPGNGGENGNNGGNGGTPLPEKVLQVRPESGGYLANSMAANTMFATRMQDRLGEGKFTRNDTNDHNNGFWMRHVGNTTSFNVNSDQMKARTNRYVVQLGMDIADWSDTGLDRWQVGLMTGYGNAHSNIRSNVTHYHTDSTVEGYSAGMYATWVQSEKDLKGTYLDSWVLYNWFRNSVNGQDLPREHYHSKGFTASVEAGYTFSLFSGQRVSGWLQPKAQFNWMDVTAKDHREENGTNVTTGNNGMLNSRLGIRAYLKGHSHLDDNTGREFQPFAEVNWIHNYDEYNVKMDGRENKILGTKDIGELKLGVESKVANNFTLWGNVAQQMGDQGYADTSVLFGTSYKF